MFTRLVMQYQLGLDKPHSTTILLCKNCVPTFHSFKLVALILVVWWTFSPHSRKNIYKQFYSGSYLGELVA